MIKSIIFDFDGVICDSVDIKTYAFQKIYSKYGKSIQEEAVKFHKTNMGVSRYDKFKIIHKKFIDIDLKPTELEDLSKIFSNIVFSEIIKCNYIPGILNFLEKYYNKIHFFISSATPELELIQIIKARKIEKYFEKIYGSPATKIDHIKKIIRLYQFDNKDIIYIGDSKSDKIAAESSDVRFVGIINKYEKFKNIQYKYHNFIEIEKNLKCL